MIAGAETEKKPEGPRRKKAGPRTDRPANAPPPETVRRLRKARRDRRKAERRGGPKTLGGRLAQSKFAQRSVAGLMHFLFEGSRMVGRERAARWGGAWMRAIGRRTPENEVGRANLAAAFPEKSEAERERILGDVWDHVARTTVEYAFLKDLVAEFDIDRPAGGLIEHHGMEHAVALRDGGKPGIIFGAHMGNWELTAAIGTKVGLPVTTLYRPPSNPYIAEEMERRRNTFVRKLVVSGRGAALQVASALRAGSHLGIIVDQRIADGPRIPFFGRRASSNPIVGMLARIFECPVHGAYSFRLPDGRYHIEMTPALVFPRDAGGKIDAGQANMMVHGMVEDWVRGAPEQWLWLHDRWRRPSRRKRKKLAAQRVRAKAE